MSYTPRSHEQLWTNPLPKEPWPEVIAVELPRKTEPSAGRALAAAAARRLGMNRLAERLSRIS